MTSLINNDIWGAFGVTGTALSRGLCGVRMAAPKGGAIDHEHSNGKAGCYHRLMRSLAKQGMRPAADRADEDFGALLDDDVDQVRELAWGPIAVFSMVKRGLATLCNSK